MITIGIIGSRGKSMVGKIIETELNRRGKRTYIIETMQDSSSVFEGLINNDLDYIIIEISREDILKKKLGGITFDVIVQTSIENEEIELISEIQKLISNIKKEGYIIFNSDSIQKINFICDNLYALTYGLNEKTTVTASSIDDVEGLCFSYCLQRVIFTIKGNIVQPFEKPIRVEGSYKDVAYFLAGYTCILLLGFSL